MLERLSWKRLLLELLFCCIPAVILGLLIGYLPWFLLAAVSALLGWHFYNQLRLSHWLWVDRSMTPPAGEEAGSRCSTGCIRCSSVIAAAAASWHC